MSPGFARGRRTARPMDPAYRLALVREIISDPRFDRLRPRATKAILTLVSTPAIPGDGRRCFWPKRDVWAKAAGLSPATLDRGIEDIARARIVHVEPWLRPNRLQGASTYMLDPVYEFLAAP